MDTFLNENASAIFTLIGTFAGGIGGFITKWLVDGRNHKRSLHKELLKVRREMYAKVLNQPFFSQQAFIEEYKALGHAIILSGSKLSKSLEEKRDVTREFLVLYANHDIAGVEALKERKNEEMKELSKRIRNEMREELCEG